MLGFLYSSVIQNICIFPALLPHPPLIFLSTVHWENARPQPARQLTLGLTGMLYPVSARDFPSPGDKNVN